MGLKQCGKCQAFKLPEEFNKNSNSEDGLQTYCRICQKEYNDHYSKQQASISLNQSEKIADVTRDIMLYNSKYAVVTHTKCKPAHSAMEAYNIKQELDGYLGKDAKIIKFVDIKVVEE